MHAMHRRLWGRPHLQTQLLGDLPRHRLRARRFPFHCHAIRGGFMTLCDYSDSAGSALGRGGAHSS